MRENSRGIARTPVLVQDSSPRIPTYCAAPRSARAPSALRSAAARRGRRRAWRGSSAAAPGASVWRGERRRATRQTAPEANGQMILRGSFGCGSWPTIASSETGRAELRLRADCGLCLWVAFENVAVYVTHREQPGGAVASGQRARQPVEAVLREPVCVHRVVEGRDHARRCVRGARPQCESGTTCSHELGR